MPAEPLDPPQPRPSYSTCRLLHNVLRILVADDCAIVITTANVGPAVRAVRDLLFAFSIEPEMGSHDPILVEAQRSERRPAGAIERNRIATAAPLHRR